MKICLSKEDYNLSAFLLHQTCEKLYYTILMVFTNYLPKTHKVKELGGMVKRFSQELTTVFPQNTGSEKNVLICYAVLILNPAITKISVSHKNNWNTLFPVLIFCEMLLNACVRRKLRNMIQ